MVFLQIIFFFTLSFAQDSFEFSELKGQTIQGSNITLDRLAGEYGLVLLARESGCPISEKIGPRLKTMEAKYAAHGLPFVFLYVGQTNPTSSAYVDKEKYGFSGPYLVDPKLSLAKVLGLKTTTEALVFSKNGKLLYRGAVDDQFAIGSQKFEASKYYLEQKIKNILVDKTITYSETTPHGCLISYPSKAVAGPSDLTYEDHIAPIFERKCLACHSSQTGVMDLSTFDLVKSRGETIEYVIAKNIMPPWNVTKGGPWVDDFSLSEDEKKLILKWLKTFSRKTGTLVNAPAPEIYNVWALGEPSKIVKMPRQVKVPADGPMEYQHFILNNPFSKDVWVRGFDFKTLPKVVHHAVVHVLKDGKDLRPEKFPVNFVSRFGWAPGARAQHFPPDVGALIPKGSKLALTVHYASNGESTIDNKTQIGFYLHSKKPARIREEWTLLDEKLDIPPGDGNYKNRIEKIVPYDAYVMAMNTHMHLRGKSSRILLQTPSGRTETIFEVDPYLFDFQFTYERQKVLLVKAGQKIICENVFDNSSTNTFNPNPNQRVLWGEKTTEEMSLCNLFVYPAKSTNDPAG